MKKDLINIKIVKDIYGCSHCIISSNVDKKIHFTNMILKYLYTMIELEELYGYFPLSYEELKDSINCISRPFDTIVDISLNEEQGIYINIFENNNYEFSYGNGFTKKNLELGLE